MLPCHSHHAEQIQGACERSMRCEDERSGQAEGARQGLCTVKAVRRRCTTSVSETCRLGCSGCSFAASAAYRATGWLLAVEAALLPGPRLLAMATASSAASITAYR